MTTQATRIRIETVEPLDGYVLRLGFNDATSRDVDLQDELWGPVFEPLRDPDFFARATFDPMCGTVVWPNGADIAPEALYELTTKKEPTSSR